MVTEVKKNNVVTISFRWFFGVIFAFASLGALISLSLLQSFLSLVIAIILIPPLNEKYVPHKWNIRGQKLLIIVIILWVIMVLAVNSTGSSKHVNYTGTSDSTTTNVIVNSDKEPAEDSKKESQADSIKQKTSQFILGTNSCDICTISEFSDTPEERRECFLKRIDCLEEIYDERGGEFCNDKGEDCIHRSFGDVYTSEDVYPSRTLMEFALRKCDDSICSEYAHWVYWGDTEYYTESCIEDVKEKCNPDPLPENCNELVGFERVSCWHTKASESGDVTFCRNQSTVPDLTIQQSTMNRAGCIRGFAKTYESTESCDEIDLILIEFENKYDENEDGTYFILENDRIFMKKDLLNEKENCLTLGT